MPTLLERIQIQSQLLAGRRSFVLGPGAVNPSDRYWGHPTEAEAPAELGSYLNTSNAVYSIATSIGGLLASLPLRLYTAGDTQNRKEITAGPLYDLVHKVNPHWTMSRMLKMTALSLCVWGHCPWVLERGVSGTEVPREIWWGRPDRFRVQPDPVNYIAGYLYYPPHMATPIPYLPGEVIWFRLPNPNDEFAPLSPLTAARVSADYGTDAMRANRNLFKNGLMPGGIVAPEKASGASFTDDQADELALLLEKRFKGVDRAHRWAVLKFAAQLQSLEGLTPKDAEFLGGVKWALEDVARAYHWPLDLVGGQRTYENLDASMKAAWTFAVLPMATDIASELTEQLLPLFKSPAATAEFDDRDVHVLREARFDEWQRSGDQIAKGAKTINEWRSEQGLAPVAWGDAWWAPSSVVPTQDATPRPATAPAPAPMPAGQQSARAARELAYGSDEHRRLWETWLGRTARQEQALGKVVADVMRRQQESVLAKLKAERSAGGRGVTDNPFDLKEWIRKLREAVRPTVKQIVQDAGDAAMADLELTVAFDVTDPAVAKFLETRVQRFATEVSQTTWDQLKASLAEGVDAGETVDELAARVEAVMGGRIASSGTTIARTEVIGASNGGTLEAWRQSGVVEEKTWLSALDDRVRPDHREAHGQTVALDDDFEVGGATGPAPGQMGDPSQDVNCRCTLTAVVSERLYRIEFSANGHKEKTLA